MHIDIWCDVPLDRPHILNGVGALFPPAHDTGLVMLQVAMGGEVISSSVVFEYKARDLPALPSSQHDWLSLDGKWTDLRELTGERERHTECVPCVSIERVCRECVYTECNRVLKWSILRQITQCVQVNNMPDHVTTSVFLFRISNSLTTQKHSSIFMSVFDWLNVDRMSCKHIHFIHSRV